MTNLKLAQRDARKTFRVSPVLTADQSFNHLHTVQMIVDLEEGVEEEQLTDGIAEVQQFHRQIGCYQVVAVQLSCKTSTNIQYIDQELALTRLQLFCVK